MMVAASLCALLMEIQGRIYSICNIIPGRAWFCKSASSNHVHVTFKSMQNCFHTTGQSYKPSLIRYCSWDVEPQCRLAYHMAMDGSGRQRQVQVWQLLQPVESQMHLTTWKLNYELNGLQHDLCGSSLLQEKKTSLYEY